VSPGPRLNLLLPTLNPGRTFGGARTALDLFDAVAGSFPRRRIVTFTAMSEGGPTGLPGFRLVEMQEDAMDDRQVVALPRGEEGSLAVGADDVFLATFWTTAELAIRIARWQAAEFTQPIRSFAYLIQDFEPGFYSWSAQSELARGTYAGEVPTVAVINTGLLRDHFAGEGIRFAAEYTFEPRLNATLRSLLDDQPRERKQRILVYGRPETPRNAFPLIVEGLREWARTDPKATGWTVESAGRSHPPVDLAPGLRLKSLGKLELATYGALLRESAVGLSLMISPHPSYPPLDMAHLGMLVATNRFGAKDLSTWHQNIRSLASLSAEGIAAALRDLTDAFEADPGVGDRGQPLRQEFLAEGPLFPFAAELAERLKVGS
jgi:O-antigen biosynthesis protein